MEMFPGYCIDTNALIDLWRRVYPQDVFPSLWKSLESIVLSGELVAPREVFKELEKQDDELLAWAKKYKKMFVDLDAQQMLQVQNILRDFPNFVDTSKTTPDADPFVIVLAGFKGWTVITSEKANLDPAGKPKIPNVCQNRNVKCIQLLSFFREKGWNF